jgi:hypothetical protein
MAAEDNLSKVLFHGTDASLSFGQSLNEGSWASTRALTAGLYGNNVYIVGHSNKAPKSYDLKAEEENVTSKGDLKVIKKINNPHWTGECGRKNCDFSEHD